MYEVEETGGFSIVYLKGEVDLDRSPEARSVILGCLRKRNPLLIDLSGVTYIDSSGIASLVEGFQMARKMKLEFGLTSVNERTLSVLRLARLDRVFPIHDSLEARLSRKSNGKK
ncbi:MAG: STAS domain-containing protein [Gammaproteobacteria bacterium]|nr:STAS domain-containing protein [Gammaproteobacteria bacterium]